ncbi:MAG TPA: crosslink repair DNA glycosylase YcaQ family protein, partial [Micromonosporaceae bacterium]
AVCARRLDRHALTMPSNDLATVVGTVCGIHAQVASAAQISIGLRVTVKPAMDQLVKTYGPRGTVHLFPATELPMWNAALASAGERVPPKLLTAAQTAAIAAVVAERDQPLTVDDLHDEVIARTGAWAGDEVVPAFGGAWPRWRVAIGVAANRGLICFGPNRGRRTTYVALPPAAAPPDALAEVARRYLWAYGPATPQQFAQWFGAPAGDTLDRLDLDEVLIDGAPAYILAGDTEVSEPLRGIRLLPYFDAYVVGSHPRTLVFPGSAYRRALSRGGAGPVPVVVVDGDIAGVWHYRRSGRTIAVTVESFVPLDARLRRDLDVQVERLGEVLGGRATVTLGPVTAGKHL